MPTDPTAAYPEGMEVPFHGKCAGFSDDKTTAFVILTERPLSAQTQEAMKHLFSASPDLYRALKARRAFEHGRFCDACDILGIKGCSEDSLRFKLMAAERSALARAEGREE